MAKIETKIGNMGNEDDEQVILTDEQKKNLIAAWKSAPDKQPPTQKELVNVAFPDLVFDGRSKQGKAVKEFFAKLSIFPKPSTHENVGPYTLSVAEKDFIQGNYDVNLDNKLEIANLLFPDKKITPLSKEFKAIYNFIKETESFNPPKEKEEKVVFFTPPRNYTACLQLINKYTHDIISIQDASERDKQGVNALSRYLHSPRFTHMVNTYEGDANRDLFVAELIRAVYDKPDLTVDEFNLYLNLCSDYVSSSQIKREIELLSKRLGDIMDDPDGKMSTSLADTISAKNKEYNDCLERQEKLINKLNGSRAIRLKNQSVANSSIKSLVVYWSEEKNRRKILHLAKIKEKARLDAVINLNSLDSVKAEIFGAVSENIL